MALLDLLAVDERPERQILGVDVGGVDHNRAERAEPVLALDAEHRAAVGVAEVVDAPVIGDRIAADVVERLVEGHPVTRSPDHDRDLTLVVEEPATGGSHDRGQVPGQ